MGVFRPLTATTAGVIAVVLAGCGGDGPGDDGDGPILIGHAADFSGDYSFYDSPMRAGAELAVAEITENGGVGGREIEYVAIDGRNDQAETLRATEELLDDGAVYLIGTTGSPWAAQATLACEEGVPISTGDGTSPDLVGQIGPCAHQVIMSDNVQAAAAAEYLLEEGVGTAYLMRSSDDPYTDGVPNYFTEVFEAGGGEIVGASEFQIGAGDYGVQATEIANLPEQPDVIFTPIFVSDTQVFLRQLRAQGVTTPVVGADGAVDASVLDAGDAAEGLIATYHAWPTDEPGPINDFVDAYTEFHGGEPDSMVAGLGYDEIHLIAQIIEDQGEATAEAITAGLADASFSGATGELTMNPDTRRADKEITLVEVRDGEIHFLESRVPQTVPPVPGD